MSIQVRGGGIWYRTEWAYICVFGIHDTEQNDLKDPLSLLSKWNNAHAFFTPQKIFTLKSTGPVLDLFWCSAIVQQLKSFFDFLYIFFHNFCPYFSLSLVFFHSVLPFFKNIKPFFSCYRISPGISFELHYKLNLCNANLYQAKVTCL